MTVGPLQLLIVGFDDDQYKKDIMRELAKVRQKGIIRLLDLLYVIKREDGTIEAQETTELTEEEQQKYGNVIRGLIETYIQDTEKIEGRKMLETFRTNTDFGLTREEIQEAAAAIPNGRSAFLVLFEHRWAVSLKEKLIEAGAEVLAQGLISPESLATVTNDLSAVIAAADKIEAAAFEEAKARQAEAKRLEEEAMAEAAVKVAEAEEIEKAAMAEAAVISQVAEMQKREAILDAAETINEADALKFQAADEAAAALVSAHLIQEAAAEEVAEVLAEARLIQMRAIVQTVDTIDESKVIQAEAIAEAEEVVEEAEAIKAAAIDEAIDAMIAADIIEDASRQRAIRAIVTAKVIEAKAADIYLTGP